jgi:hypothetical protein
MLMNRTQNKILIFLGNIVLMVLSILLTLCLAEFAARYFLNPPFIAYLDDKPESQCDRMLGWRTKSHTVKIDATDGYVHQVVTNSAGMHDREHALHKDKDVFRILVLGDSFVAAEQVTEREGSHSVIESVLNTLSNSHIRYEVISAGESGWGPAQELMYFRTAGHFYNPDLVLVFWYAGNDLSDVIPDHSRSCSGIGCYSPYFAVCNGRFDTEPWFSVPGISPAKTKCSKGAKALTRSLNYLYHQSRLYQQLTPLLAQRQSGVKLSFRFSPWLEDNHDEILEYAYQVTDGIFTTLANEANQVGAKTAVIIVSPKEAINFELLSSRKQLEMIEQIKIQYPSFSGKLNNRLCNQKITKLMTVKSIPVLDLHPAFVKYLRAGGHALYCDKDGHWNVHGNKMAGELIVQWLVNNQLVHFSR